MTLFIHFCAKFLFGVSFVFCCSSSSEDEKSDGNNKHSIFNNTIPIEYDTITTAQAFTSTTSANNLSKNDTKYLHFE